LKIYLYLYFSTVILGYYVEHGKFEKKLDERPERVILHSVSKGMAGVGRKGGAAPDAFFPFGGASRGRSGKSVRI
jgi:hypothetical protein